MTVEGILNELHMLVGIALAVALGFIIGLERKFRAKEAGIRTHTIVCVGSALMVVVSKYAFDGLGDPARVAAQIVSGIGFLGAGMIIYRKNEVHGLTTAAGVWATAGVGMAAGGELYTVAIGATLILILIQCILHINIKLFKTKILYRLRIVFYDEDGGADKIKDIFQVTRFNNFVTKREGERILCSATLTTDMEYPSSCLREIMAGNDFITSIDRGDEK